METYNRVETKQEVKLFIETLKDSLHNKTTKIRFQQDRRADTSREERYRNRFTVNTLFPSDDPVKALKRELATLEIGDYIETHIDNSNPQLEEFRIFVKMYDALVYIKLRVQVLPSMQDKIDKVVFIMSFHYAEYTIADSKFPYKEKIGEKNENY